MTRQFMDSIVHEPQVYALPHHVHSCKYLKSAVHDAKMKAELNPGRVYAVVCTKHRFFGCHINTYELGQYNPGEGSDPRERNFFMRNPCVLEEVLGYTGTVAQRVERAREAGAQRISLDHIF